jgi:glycosyltransferase involved in cell wall biosynthesis
VRYHHAFAELAIPLGDFSNVTKAEHLTAVRFEPVVRANSSAGVVDVHFSDGDRRGVIPFLIVDVAMLEVREREPLVWPERAAALGRLLEADAIGDAVEAWLRELAAIGPLSREQWKFFGTADHEKKFLDARASGFLGAASIEIVARKAAPFIFARRHGRSRDVVIAARDGELGSVLLTPYARGVEILTRDAAAEDWYGSTSVPGAREVAIVDIDGRGRDEIREAQTIIDLDGGEGVRIEPAPVVPVDSLFDFTGIVRRREVPFFVHVRSEREPRTPLVPKSAPIGGSSGHIVFGLRGRALAQGGADVDLARLLAEAMRDEGFTVDLVDDVQSATELQPDLIHAFGVADGTLTAAYGRAAQKLGIPFALHPLYDAPARGGYWGATVTPYCFRFMQDELTVAHLCSLMRVGRLAINTVVADGDFHPTQPRWRDDVRAALEMADAIFTLGPQETDAILQLAPSASIVSLPMPVAESPAVTAVEALTGPQAYALMHAPIEATQNQLQAVRAAQLANVPLVIAGPVADADYAALVRAFAGDRVVILGEPDAATLEGLYRGADVFVDIAWVGTGLARAARAVSRGAAVVFSDRMPGSDLNLGNFGRGVSPGDAQGIARGLGDTWTIRQHESEKFEEMQASVVPGWGVREVTAGVVAAYGQAIEKRNMALS